MVFSSLNFLFIFLPTVLILYFLCPKTSVRNAVLLFASILFYAWGEPVYVILMLFSILINYVLGLDISRSDGRRRKVQFVTAVGVNLFILGFFKYYAFFADGWNALTGWNLPIRRLALPVGISFYTFQILSYIIDVYKGKVGVQKNIMRFALYVTMFPQLIAGPIVRYEDIEKQLAVRTVSFCRFAKGCETFIFGLSKKVLLANNLGALAAMVQTADTRSALGAWLGLIAYTLQIYFDFSGYSDMAVGLGHMLGFSFMQNFNYPYLSGTVTEFWRRWHISLGTWFREYVYIPLGGNRVRPIRHVINILAVWTLTGLWHGAGWNFVLWGLYYGVLLLIEKYFLRHLPEKLPMFFRRIYTLFAVMIGWVLFSMTDLTAMSGYFLDLFGRSGAADGTAIYQLVSYGVLILAGCICAGPWMWHWFRRRTHDLPVLSAAITVLLLMVCTAYLVYSSYNPFLYFQF